MRHCGLWIVHHDIRRPDTIVQRETGWYLDAAFVGAEERGRQQGRAYGARPKGIAFFDAGGRYIMTVMRPDRAKYASNALWQGTPEENRETADGVGK